MNTITSQFAASGQAVITPEMLAATLRMSGHEGVFLIKGFARDVKPWSKDGKVRAVYGMLELGQSAIKFSTGPANAPVEGEAVVLSACLAISPAKSAGRHNWTGTYTAILRADKVGAWTPDEDQRNAVRLSPRPERMALTAFLELHGLGELAVLATSSAQTDLYQALTNAGVADRPQVMRARFDQEADIIAAAREAAAAGAAGIALVRGGGAGLELTANSPRLAQALIDLELPFYNAQGHGEDVFLLDKYADECFATPSLLGAAIARALSEIDQRHRMTEDLADALEAAGALQAALDKSASAAEGYAHRLQAAQAARARRLHLDDQGLSLSWPVALAACGVLVMVLCLAIGLAR